MHTYADILHAKPLDVNPVSQSVKMDLNKKSLPKQKTIKPLRYKTQGFQITINKNPRPNLCTVEILRRAPYSPKLLRIRLK